MNIHLRHTERLRWLDALNEDGMAYLTAYHHICLNAKVALKAFATGSS